MSTENHDPVAKIRRIARHLAPDLSVTVEGGTAFIMFPAYLLPILDGALTGMGRLISTQAHPEGQADPTALRMNLGGTLIGEMIGDSNGFNKVEQTSQNAAGAALAEFAVAIGVLSLMVNANAEGSAMALRLQVARRHGNVMTDEDKEREERDAPVMAAIAAALAASARKRLDDMLGDADRP